MEHSLKFDTFIGHNHASRGLWALGRRIIGGAMAGAASAGDKQCFHQFINLVK
jgi:hypothetical protein